MARSKTTYNGFNRGLISTKALARVDLDRVNLSAEVMTNFVPRRLGSMMFRPGTAYIGATASNNAGKLVPFIYADDDTALIEFTPSLMRVWVNDSLVTRASVSSSVTNGGFDSDVTGWTDNDESGATSAWVTGGYLGLTGDGTNAAIREQEVTVAAADQSVEHALDIVIDRGPVEFRVGSTTGNDDYVAATTLGTGYHSLSFTPTGNFFIEFSSRLKRIVRVDSVAVASSGVMTLTAPYAGADMDKIRWDQSADVIYLATAGYKQYKIERRNTTSWSIVEYQPEDGPFRSINLSEITLTPSALTGNITLTASKRLFQTTQVGALWRIVSTGQEVTADVSAQDTFTNAIRVTGVTSSRVFTIIREGTWVATVTLQRSLTSETGPWEDVTTYTTNATITYDDTLDNQIAWYRIGVKTGDYTSGTAELTLDYGIGSIDGIVRITGYTNETTVAAEVITDLGGTDATKDWYEGEWSSFRGYPTAVALAEGRLGWAGKSRVYLSVSDAYESFDDSVEGDSGPITRTIGQGPVDNINWMVALSRLCFGTDSAEWSVRSSSEDEPLTPLNANPKTFSTQGSADVIAVKNNDTALFIQQAGTKLMESAFGPTGWLGTKELNLLFPEAGNSKFLRLAMQQKPDPRIHCIREDGMVAMLIYDPIEEVSCWTMIESGDGAETVPADDGETWNVFVGSTTITDTNTGSEVTETLTNVTLTGTEGDSLDIDADTEAPRFGITFSPDGTKMFIGNRNASSGTATYNDILSYTLSTAWDITTASKDAFELDVTTEIPNSTQHFQFSDDGLKLFVLARNNPSGGTSAPNDDPFIARWTLSSAYTLSGASYDGAGKELDLSSYGAYQKGMQFSADGTRLWTCSYTQATQDEYTIHEFSLSTAWDVSTASFVQSVEVEAPVLEYDGQLEGFKMGVTGQRFYLYFYDDGVLRLHYYDMSTLFEVSTATLGTGRWNSDGTSVASTVAYSFDMKPDESMFWIIDPNNVTGQLVYEFSVEITEMTTTEITETYPSITVTVSSSSFVEYSSTTAQYTTVGIEDVAVLPAQDGNSEDQVYYIVNRDIGGSTNRYIEKWSLESECEGGTINKNMDAHVLGTVTNGQMTGLDHLEGKEVAVWLNGKDLGRYTVSSGAITGVTEDGSNACAGIVYTARYKSSKIQPLTEKKNVGRVGLILENTHYQGMKYGQDFDNLDNLPLTKDEAIQAADTVHSRFDEESIGIDGAWDSDARMCITAQSPRPVTCLVAVVDSED